MLPDRFLGRLVCRRAKAVPEGLTTRRLAELTILCCDSVELPLVLSVRPLLFRWYF
jgi:hypothetical protein